MRYAVISDIHGNYEALSAVLSDIYSNKVEMILCLGDVVGYGPNPNECTQLIRDHCHHTIMGNHDAAVFDPIMPQEFNKNARIAIEWTSRELNKKSRDFLNNLPLKWDNDELLAVHATPYDSHLWYYITSIEDARFNFNFFSHSFCFTGHTHIPGIIRYEENSGEIAIIKPCNYRYNDENSRFIVNVGSVGQPRDRDSRSCYVILDTDTKEVLFRRVEYDIQGYQGKMRLIGMPEFLVTRVGEGR